ncbi:MAG: hypothetical protein U1A27_03050 [Phycisphaerae bacterium]
MFRNNDTLTYTVTGSPVRAFMLGTSTCNVGDQPANWINNGPPGVGFEMYRLHNGRMVQIGLSWVKHACCAAEVTKRDVRAVVHLHAGVEHARQGVPGHVHRQLNGKGRAGWADRTLIPTSKRLRRAAGRQREPRSTGGCRWPMPTWSRRDLPLALYFAEGVYVATDDALSFNWLNNASYRRVTVSGSLTMKRWRTDPDQHSGDGRRLGTTTGWVSAWSIRASTCSRPTCPARGASGWPTR